MKPAVSSIPHLLLAGLCLCWTPGDAQADGETEEWTHSERAVRAVRNSFTDDGDNVFLAKCNYWLGL